MGYSNPQLETIHTSVPLQNFSQFWMQDENEFVSIEAMPNVPTRHKTDLYREWNRGDLFRDEFQEVAPGEPAPIMQHRTSTTPFSTRVRKLSAFLHAEQFAEADDEVNLRETTTAALLGKGMISREREWASVFFNAAAWTSSLDVSGTTEWNEAMSTPVTEIRTGLRTVKQLTGKKVNRMVFGQGTWDAVVDNDDILSRIIGGALTSQPAIVQRQLIAQLFEVDSVMVAGGVYNTADFDDAESNAFIANDGLLVYHAPSTVSPMVPSSGVGFSWRGYNGDATQNGVRIRNWFEEKLEGEFIEAIMAYDYKVTAPALGYFFENTLS